MKRYSQPNKGAELMYIHAICVDKASQTHGAVVAQRLSNALPHNDPGFDSRWGRCKNQASRPSQGTVYGDAVSK